MKTRASFITNSSSSSFIIDKSIFENVNKLYVDEALERMFQLYNLKYPDSARKPEDCFEVIEYSNHVFIEEIDDNSSHWEIYDLIEEFLSAEKCRDYYVPDFEEDYGYSTQYPNGGFGDGVNVTVTKIK